MEKINKDTHIGTRMENCMRNFEGKILDVGCKDCKAVIKSTLHGLDITGCDISMDNLNKGISLANNSGVEINVEQCSIYDLTKHYGRNTFDTVFAGELIEHLEIIERGMFELWNVTKPGGVIILTTPAGFAHYDQDHKNFFFKKPILDTFNKYWLFDMLPFMFLQTAKIYDIDNVLSKVTDCTFTIREMEWKESKHESLDFLIYIRKNKEE